MRPGKFPVLLQELILTLHCISQRTVLFALDAGKISAINSTAINISNGVILKGLLIYKSVWLLVYTEF